jgi:hypothetical protein
MIRKTLYNIKMPHYYPLHVKVLAHVHLQLELYCSDQFRKVHCQNKRLSKSFKLISKVEFLLRNKVRMLTKKAKEDYSAKCQTYLDWD